FRFTCAHELGHLMLHGNHAESFSDKSVGTSSEVIEREADRFATAFLMPLGSFVEKLFTTLDTHRLDRRQCLALMLAGGPECNWLWRKRLLPAITRIFGVSLPTARYRATDVILPAGAPLLLADQLAELLQPAEPTDPVHDVRVVNGVPQLRQS